MEMTENPNSYDVDNPLRNSSVPPSLYSTLLNDALTFGAYCEMLHLYALSADIGQPIHLSIQLQLHASVNSCQCYKSVHKCHCRSWCLLFARSLHLGLHSCGQVHGIRKELRTSVPTRAYFVYLARQSQEIEVDISEDSRRCSNALTPPVCGPSDAALYCRLNGHTMTSLKHRRNVHTNLPMQTSFPYLYLSEWSRCLLLTVYQHRQCCPCCRMHRHPYASWTQSHAL